MPGPPQAPVQARLRQQTLPRPKLIDTHAPQTGRGGASSVRQLPRERPWAGRGSDAALVGAAREIPEHVHSVRGHGHAVLVAVPVPGIQARSLHSCASFQDKAHRQPARIAVLGPGTRQQAA